MKSVFARAWPFVAAVVVLTSGVTSAQTEPQYPGRLVDLGGHRLHLNCSGAGDPTIVVETGFQEFSFDWILVQRRVSEFTTICTYDRAGYAWSDPGPLPRTNAQINLELHDALKLAAVRAPYILVGHSYGGPLVRTFAAKYPRDVAGVILAESTAANDRYAYNGQSFLIRAGSNKRAIPPPRETGDDSHASYATRTEFDPKARAQDPFDRLPPLHQAFHVWAEGLPQLNVAEDSERTWSPQSLEELFETNQRNALQGIPLIVLTRMNGGFSDTKNLSAEEENENWRAGQDALATLSVDSLHYCVNSGHEIEVDDPDDVVGAIRLVVDAVRERRSLRSGSRNALPGGTLC